MSHVLPRVVAVKLETRPRKAFVWATGSDELARMAELPNNLPDMTVAYYFTRRLDAGLMRPKPDLLNAAWTMPQAKRTKSELQPCKVEWVPE